MPIEISRVLAVRFIRPMDSGRTHPGLFTCVTEDGEWNEYIVKFRPHLRKHCICEMAAAILGHYMGIPIPSVATVDVPPKLAPLIDDNHIRGYVESDDGPHVGSEFLGPGINPLPHAWLYRGEQPDMITRTFIFDVLIQNADRSFSSAQGSPNTIMKGDQLWFIDHEVAFSFVDLIVPPADPWPSRQDPSIPAHIFYYDARKAITEDAGIVDETLRSYSTSVDAAIRDIRSNCPAEWQDGSTLPKIVLHLEQIRDDLDLFKKKLLEVLA